jgi:uncharacterized protein YdeI (YjbR/CyaY-like superfamily)
VYKDILQKVDPECPGFRVYKKKHGKMTKNTIAEGVVHEVPGDLRKALVSNPGVLDIWNNLTPLSRNEWICWAPIPKKPETRKEHIERLCEELLEGKRRPCCWPGCPHRNPNAKKWFK